MLACVGFIVPEFVHLPGPVFAESNPLKAIYAVPIEGWIQIITAICLIELAQFKTTFANGATLGFDPLGLAAGGDRQALAEGEVINGRLAMIGILGFACQIIASGKPIVAQLTSFF